MQLQLQTKHNLELMREKTKTKTVMTSYRRLSPCILVSIIHNHKTRIDSVIVRKGLDMATSELVGEFEKKNSQSRRLLKEFKKQCENLHLSACFDVYAEHYLKYLRF